MEPNHQWGSTLNFILVSAGAAIGLGNIWKFPYVLGSMGGGYFLMAFFLALLLLGFPILVAEVLLGRWGQRNILDTFLHLQATYQTPRGTTLIAYLGLIILFAVLSFYTVVAGWIVYYGYLQGTGALMAAASTPTGLSDLWIQVLHSPAGYLIAPSSFLFMTLWIISGHFRNGIELMNRFLMPLLFLILIGLFVYVVTQYPMEETWSYFLRGDQTQNLDTLTILRAALGQAFFSLATGAGCMLVYGAYIPQGLPIVRSLAAVTFLNVCVALLASGIIFPLVFAYHLTPTQGSELMFHTLPLAFVQMPGGLFLGTLFFILLWCAALTSSVSMAEPLVLGFIQRCHLSRTQSTFLLGVLLWFSSTFLAYSLTKPGILGFDSYFDLVATVTTDRLLPLGALGMTLLVGYYLPLPVLADLLHCSPQHRLLRIWYLLLRYIAPSLLVLLLMTH